MTDTEVEDFASMLSKVSLFGGYEGATFETAKSERLEREKKVKMEMKRREKELLKAKDEKKRQEEEDRLFAIEEQERINRKHFIHLKNAKGRAARIQQNVLESYKPIGRGRGRLPCYESPDTYRDSYFQREENVKNQISQFTNGLYHSNSVQKQIWQDEAPTASSSRDSSPPLSHYEPYQDKFEDTHSFTKNTTSDNSALLSFPDSFSLSPILGSSETIEATAPLLQEKNSKSPPVPQGVVHKPRRRLAAKFSLNYDDEYVETKETLLSKPQQSPDRFAVLSSNVRRVAPTKIRSTLDSISINSLSPSQRMLSNEVLQSEELNPYRQHDFKLDNKDFPAL